MHDLLYWFGCRLSCWYVAAITFGLPLPVWIAFVAAFNILSLTVYFKVTCAQDRQREGRRRGV
jgi:hypothetical protein